MDFIKNLFRKKWGTCALCNKTIYVGDIYGSLTLPASELSLTGKPSTSFYCESCTKSREVKFDEKWYLIKEKGRAK
ncbi:MAG: hypothetical protein JXR46_14735 [Calditrichaceae bacterium]|nr:hypothetical protein [Calditrichaceae bacterium]MBN2710296.1 hypothetical protein [Calditrichaceae bacterium]RQV93000.1 MAG: hypothetical protein EH224_13620 [Calditrichota bacterium]